MSSEYGKRYTCFKCECKFYDLKKSKAICPRCQTDQAPTSSEEKTESKLLKDIILKFNLDETKDADQEKQDDLLEEDMQKDFTIDAVTGLHKVGKDIELAHLNESEE